MAILFGTTCAVLSHVATRFHLVALRAAFGKLKTRRHGETISLAERDCERWLF